MTETITEAQDVKTPFLEVPRAAFHMVATTSAITYFYLTDLTGAMVLLVVGIVLTGADILRTSSSAVRQRLPRFMLRMVREREQTRISGITHFVIAATVVDFLYLFAALPKDAALAATMYVAFGDPMARFAGLRFGRSTILNTGKTWVGSTVFFVVGSTAALVASLALGAHITAARLALGGVATTAVELFTGDWDNLAVPLGGTLIFWGLAAFGI